MPTVIPGLPKHLETVPPAPVSPDDPLRDQKRADWLVWRDRVIADNDRYQHHLATTADKEGAIRDELALCAAHPAYWLARWGTIFEPRTRGGRGGESPFVPFAKQVDLLDFFLACLAADGPEGDAAISKSRDMGASWITCAFALWGWLFRTPWQVRLVSYKEQLVDEGYQKHPDSLFWKIDYLRDRLPGWMLPAGFANTKHRNVLYLANPANGNVVGGMSSTSKAGRAGRATWIAFDEYAIFEDGDDAWSSAANTTDHRFAISSEHIDYGDHFLNLQRGENGVKVAMHPLNWWEHPHHDDEWHAQTKKRFASEGRLDAFYREVERNVYAGAKTWVYEAARTKTVAPGTGYVPGSPLYGSIDPGLRDQCALIWATEDLKTGELVILDGYTMNGQPADFYGSVITGQPESGEWRYDEEALRVMRWTAHLPRATWFGDHNGSSKEAATGDSVYHRLERYGIYVNADRTPEGDLSSAKREARTFKGRKEAALEYLPRTRFAATPGAEKVLAALQGARYKPEDGKTTTEQGEPMHDWTSHFRTAYEYLCVHLKMRRDLALRGPSRTATRPERYRPVAGPRWNASNDLPRLPGVPR